MPHLLTITETFQITNIGLAIGRLTLEEFDQLDVEFKEAFEVELRRPDGSVERARAVVPVQHVAPMPADGPQYGKFLPQATKHEVPEGTEVWVV